jgi:hypothetical protein
VWKQNPDNEGKGEEPDAIYCIAIYVAIFTEMQIGRTVFCFTVELCLHKEGKGKE